jgi:D-alanine-D-alanine ligase
MSTASRSSSRAGTSTPSPQGAVPRTLGPLSDLERHLPPEWWRTLFNAVYLKTDGDVVENQELTRTEVDLIQELTGIDAKDRILDMCCGQGRHALELARRGFTSVTGLDRSRYLIRLARRRTRQEHLHVSFREGDARRCRFPEDSFDCVLVLGNSFGYFERPEDDVRVLTTISRCLRPGGILLMDIADGAWQREHHEARSWEWVDQDQFVCRERTLSADGSRLISREVVVDAEQGVIADQFYAERLYTEAEILTLLREAGFRGVRLHGQHATTSERNQDLGMMARRLLVTARSPGVVTARRGRIPFPRVTILLGDPRLPDPVKLGGQFNQEDLQTVQNLQQALSTLEDYEFTYLDNHDTLLSALRTSPPAFVLNFCDEGYDNDAFRELHVPAYLELLGIPYSGAGPACLGLCYDKGLVSCIAESLDIPVPLETHLAPDDLGGTLPSVFPALLKPSHGDSSVGITSSAVVRNPEEALAYLSWLREHLPGRSILVQEYLTGAEYSVTLIGNAGLGFTTLPILEVDYERLPPDLPPILCYESKWDPDSPYWSEIRYREARCPEEVQRHLVDCSTRLFERLECRDYARFDFRSDAEGTPRLLEVNPNPGWCWDGKMNLMAGMGGYRYAELLRLILEAAQQRLTCPRVGGST